MMTSLQLKKSADLEIIATMEFNCQRQDFAFFDKTPKMGGSNEIMMMP